ncbi:MAG: MBOAT family protein [Methylococcales bacterium]
MLFNSYEFIFLFLPTVLVGYFIIGSKYHHRLAVSWLVGTSLFYYAWWNPSYLGLIIFSMLFNYSIGITLSSGNKTNKSLLTLGIVTNLLLLGYYKYANFLLDNVNGITNSAYSIENIILPLAISFFTFQQIAYLIDSYQKKTREYNFLNYALFVTFFPQLIAGPIVHHKEMLSQFASNITFRPNIRYIEMGLAIFSLGIFKKVIIADGISAYSTPLFNAAFNGDSFSTVDAWIGALSYSFQLYFDFSAYSDMAIGVGLMFGIKLPLNFFSPYKARNIIDFWGRWHMTLSRFLRDYLYIPLGGNRNGNTKRYRNLMITMLLGGLWHGAGWTFIVWGGLHGIFLIINHGWHHLRRHFLGHDLNHSSFIGNLVSCCITFLAVTIAWVFFRATDFSSAVSILSIMFSIDENASYAIQLFASEKNDILIWLLSLSIIVWIAPNVSEWTKYSPYEDTKLPKPAILTSKINALLFKPTVAWSIFSAAIAITAIINLSKASEFLYFQF